MVPTMRDLARSRDTRHTRWAWLIASSAFVILLGSAGFRATPSVLMKPLHAEFGWSHGTISLAVSVNLVLFGLFSPFAAALMDRFGMRRVVVVALALTGLGSLLTMAMTASWQLVMLWGVVIGLATGAMSGAFIATVTTRWFVARRGLVSGILVAANATGQLIFLPLVAMLAETSGWRTVSLVVGGCALAVIPLVLLCLRDHPHDLGLVAYGAHADDPGPDRPGSSGHRAGRALGGLWFASGKPAFWLLVAGFAICGASTNGLVGTHFVPAAHDHGMPTTMAAGLLALVGVFDIAGTVVSGWLTDRMDPRLLLVTYYVLRGLSLLVLPSLFGPEVQPSMWAFIVFYGLDWVATVPPTIALCREHFGDRAPIVYGWVFAAHQVGAAAVALGAGLVRDVTGSYTGAWLASGGLCLLAALASLAVRRRKPATAGADRLAPADSR
jgi:sugar phosphate permease